jgi:hypothetical protein
LRIQETAEDRANLKALSDLVGHSICHPEAMAARAGVAEEEAMGDWGYRMQLAYGTDLWNADWQNCGIKTNNLIDLNGGGDLNKMHAAFIAFADSRARPKVSM